MNGLAKVLEPWSQSPGSERLGSTLLHFVWQGALLAGITWVLLAVMERARPQVRYLLSLTMLAVLAACPIITFVVVDVAAADAAKHTASDSAVIAAAFHRPDNSPANASALPPTAPVADAWNAWLSQSQDWLQRHRLWMVLGWASGVCLLSLRLAVGLIGAERARRLGVKPIAEPVQEIVARLALRLGIRRPVHVFESVRAEVPTLVGWFRPVILLPVSAVTGLTASQLEAIIVHELAHIRRHDYLVNLLQTVMETVLFYHPAVWWLSSTIRQEREHCCDDVAVSTCGDRVAYARALTAMEQLRASVPRWAVAANGGSLGARIRRLVNRPEPPTGGRAVLLATAVVVMLVACVTATGRQRAFAQDARQGDSVQKAASKESSDEAAGKPPRDPNRPWSVSGRVTDAQGKPLEGVAITGHAGNGSLRLTGKAITNADGKYELDFGPGVAMMKDDVQLQSAWISASKAGLAEKNQSRQGHLLAALKLPKDPAALGKKKKDDVILPGKTRHIDFVMVPAGKESGQVIDNDKQGATEAVSSTETVTIELDSPDQVEGNALGVVHRIASPAPGSGSKSNLKRTRPDAKGRFTITFDNPVTTVDGERWTLDPEKHQVVVQIFQKNAGGQLVDKILQQVPAREAGEYRLFAQVDPVLLDHSSMSVTFVTLQPHHDQWVKAFFEDGRGTSYRGIWAADNQPLTQVAIDGQATGWIGTPTR